MSTFETVKAILGTTLQLGDRTESLEVDTPLLGEMAEFDSMAVVTVLTAIEETFGCEIDDDEITAELFETVGSLVEFVEEKLA